MNHCQIPSTHCQLNCKEAGAREALQARAAIGFTAGPEPPAEIMYMPVGEHELHASRSGRPVTVRVQVDPRAATALQESLSAHLAATAQRPYFDFDHEDKAASAWPLGFTWREIPAPGVYVRLEWSQAGAEAIRGKTYRAFSPTFFDEGNPAQVVGAPLNMGGLVNNPAFKEILPLWAKAAGPISSTNQNQNTSMTEQEVAVLQARLKQLEQEKAAAAVKAAVARGALPPQNETLQAKWREWCEASPEMIEALNALPGKEQLAQPITGGSSQRVEITREDTNHSLIGYLNAKSPREKGQIYRKELDPILAKGERIPFERLAPIQAANTLGALVGNIISQRALALVYSRRPALLNVVTDFSDEQARLNQTVYTRTIGLPTVQNFGGAVSDTAVVDYPVPLNNHKEARFQFLASEYNATGRNLVAEHSEALAVAIGNHLVDSVAALITGAFTAGAVLGAGRDYATIVAATKALNIAGVPDIDRNAWVNSDVAADFRNDELIMANFDRTGEAYARWQNVEGFREIREFPALPTNAISLVAFFFHRNALLLAARISQNPEDLVGAGYPGRIQVVTDPVTGLSVISNQWIVQDTLAINDRLIILYGAARGNLTCGYKLTSA